MSNRDGLQLADWSHYLLCAQDRCLVFSTEVSSIREEIWVLCSRQGGSSWFLMGLQQSAVPKSYLCLLKERVSKVALNQYLASFTGHWVVKNHLLTETGEAMDQQDCIIVWSSAGCWWMECLSYKLCPHFCMLQFHLPCLNSQWWGATPAALSRWRTATAASVVLLCLP